MPSDERELLAVLKAELAFLEKGGYRNGPGARPRQTFVFEDSPTCLSFGRIKNGVGVEVGTVSRVWRSHIYIRMFAVWSKQRVYRA
jgi:hypothetical protein